MQIRIDQIVVGERYRKDYGDIEGLAASIEEVGQLHPIGIDSNYRLIFGERRIKACELLGRETVEGNIIHIDNLLKGEYAENEFSKGWTVSERVAILEAIETKKEGRPQKNSENFPSKSEAAKRAGFGNERTARDATKVVNEGSPELVEAMDAGEVSVSAAADVATLPKEEQAEVVAKGEKEILQKAKEIRTEKARRKREERVEKIIKITSSNEALPFDKRYPVIYADPPWRYEHIETESRAIENQYPTMDLNAICALQVPAHNDSILFLWTTSPKLEEGMRVLREWGFSYRTCAIWDKQKIGMGYYFRQQHEILLVGTKGSLPTPLPANRPPSVFSYPRGEHSAKPHEVAELIEAMYPELPKLEMFCRSPRAGWDVWGNQSAA